MTDRYGFCCEERLRLLKTCTHTDCCAYFDDLPPLNSSITFKKVHLLMMNIPADICEKRLLSIISAVYMKELMSLCQNVQYVCLCEIRSCTLLDW